MKISLFLLPLAALGLSSCAGLTGGVIMGADAAGIVVTKPSEPPPADLALQIPQHQTWCYSTMGDAQCFAHPQNVAPERLINVDPQNAYPVDLPAYREALIGRPAVTATSAPTALQPINAAQVEKDTLTEEMTRDQPGTPPPVVVTEPPVTAAP